MGAGASTATPPPAKGKGKEKKPPKAPDPKAVLAKAAESEADAKALFASLDGDGDSKLSKAELQEAVKKAKAVENWPDPLIEQVIAFFGSGDDMLSLEQFTEALAELKSRDGKPFDVEELKAKAKAKADAMAEWKQHVKKDDDGKELWDKGCTGKLIRKYQDKEAYWEDFGLKVTTWHASLTGDEGKRAVATFAQFMALYPSLLDEMVEIKKSWDEADKVRVEEAAIAKANEFKEGKEEWEVTMKRMEVAMNAAWLQGKTPLLVDCTTHEGEDRNAGFSPLESFYSYSGDILIEMKKAVVEVGVKKEKTVEEIQKEFAKKLLMSVKQGRQLILLCSNSAPPFKSKFAHNELFPYGLLDAAKVKSCLGVDASPTIDETDLFKGLVKFMNDEGLKQDAQYSLLFGHDDFRVVVVTKFSPEDYKEFLKEEFDFERMQPIKVTIEQ